MTIYYCNRFWWCWVLQINL